ncbi:laminin G [Halorussus limi]|uniref:dolichyl-phosphooligosaccharide-protein glycotransferase n=1 Tax=Halorussus limi TaxID=2938695 RepID=A0A8U0HVY0_9EURY|nr:LamG-like jellyroll fold domain-containing protein [Halorussus limi]UPV75242.1 laminin G [Halorussus limi]
MTDVREATDDLLAEKPNLESDLREVLSVDERTNGWSFDDVPLDSGTFGELVSRDIVAKDSDAYEVRDPRAVRAVLDGDSDTAVESERGDGPNLPSLSLPSVSIAEAGALGAALAFVLLMRTYIYPSVFRGDYVVLPSNDPYYYRYWVEQLAADATGIFDFSVLSRVPSAVAKGEPLMVGTLWWLTNLLGGADAAGWVLAWYPVVSALLVGVLVYGIAVRVTGDRRVALASVVFLAVIPAFAYRTGLGFADHHAFDYPWLALTALALVLLADVDRNDLAEIRPWLAAGVLGVAVAGQVMAWEAGPLLIGALGAYVAVRAAVDVRVNRSPLVSSTPILVGLAFASVLTHLAHTGFGWHTDVVAYSPMLLFVGVLAVSLAGEAVRRAEMPAFVLGGAEVAGVLTGLLVLQTFLPTYAARLNQRLTFLLFKSGPAETQSIFAGGASGFFIGPILELGFAWFLGLPMLALVGWRAYRQERRAWLVVSTYGWYFLVLATFQRRFVGEFAPFIAIFAGYGFVVLSAKLDVTSPVALGDDEPHGETWRPLFGLPERGTVTMVVILLLFVTSAGAVQTGVRHEQVKIEDEKFEAATWIDEYADEQGLEYPENYVLSKWGRNRVYNYFVNGEARSYKFAENHYESFLSSRNPESQYQKLNDRVGFIVTKDIDVQKVPKNSNYARLHHRFGSAGTNGRTGAGHYRALYASDSKSIKVFGLVPGARIVGNASPGEKVTISKEVEVEGAKFDYERTVKANPYGVFSVTVPYAGKYTVDGDTQSVSEVAVTSGQLVKSHRRSGLAHWPFEKARDKAVYDRVGGHRGTVNGSTSQVDGVSGKALAFDQNKTKYVEMNVTAPQQFTLSLWVKPDRIDVTEKNDYRRLISSPDLSNVLVIGEGRQIVFRVPGVERSYFGASEVPVGEWSQVTATYNGTHRTIYVNGTQVGTDRIGNRIVDWNGQLRLGSGYSGETRHAYNGAIDEVRIFDRALTPEEVRQRYEADNATAT